MQGQWQRQDKAGKKQGRTRGGARTCTRKEQREKERGRFRDSGDRTALEGRDLDRVTRAKPKDRQGKRTINFDILPDNDTTRFSSNIIDLVLSLLQAIEVLDKL